MSRYTTAGAIRVFFAKEPDGVCFCFTHPLEQEGSTGSDS